MSNDHAEDLLFLRDIQLLAFWSFQFMRISVVCIKKIVRLFNKEAMEIKNKNARTLV